MATTYIFDPPYAESGNILSTTIGGRDNLAQSVALGDTMVLSNTVVNNIRFAFNRTAIHRTHVDFFGPNDVGVNSYSYLDDYMLLDRDGRLQPGRRHRERRDLPHQHLHVRRRPDDDPRRRTSSGSARSVAFWDSLSQANVRSPGTYTLRRRRDRASAWPTS